MMFGGFSHGAMMFFAWTQVVTGALGLLAGAMLIHQNRWRFPGWAVVAGAVLVSYGGIRSLLR